MERRTSKGFTIVELTLAVAFIAMLLLAVAFVTIKAGSLYEKGMTIRSVNQAGRELMDVLRRDIVQGGSQVQFVTTTTGKGKTYRLCINGVSYIANSASLLLDTASNTNKIVKDRTPVVLARLADPAATLCSASTVAVPATATTHELFSNLDVSLAVHDFEVVQLLKTRNQSLYKVRIVIGTNKEGAIDTAGTYCRPNSENPNDAKADFNYCSIAEFNTVIRVGGSI